MHIHHHWQNLPAAAQGASCAMGNFDGVHLGHQAVLDLARTQQAPLGVITFEPHPRQFFSPHSAPFRLMNAQARADQLSRLGVEHLYQLPFTPVLANYPPEGFVKEVLVQGLGISQIVVGADFRFGKSRAGSIDDLREMGRHYGFQTIIADIIAQGQQDISSTAIRQALSGGNPLEAKEMLGHWYRLSGPVLHGEKRGRELGYQTANMSVDGLHLPKFGVYAVFVDVLDGPHIGSYLGAASLGIRPMFNLNTPNLETHLFDFDGDLYGAHLAVSLVAYLRPEQHFDTLEALIRQMGLDCEQAKDILTQTPRGGQ